MYLHCNYYLFRVIYNSVCVMLIFMVLFNFRVSEYLLKSSGQLRDKACDLAIALVGPTCMYTNIYGGVPDSTGIRKP